MTASQEVVVEFRLRVKLHSDHLVCVVGSGAELGSWEPRKAKVLVRSKLHPHEWHREILLKRSEKYSYRYFLCKAIWETRNKPLNKETGDIDLNYAAGIVICQWESQVKCRSINTSESTPFYILPLAQFGCLDDQRPRLSKGWLIDATEIRLRLLGEQPMKLFNPDICSGVVGIKCIPVDYTDDFGKSNVHTSHLGPHAAADDMLKRFLLTSAVPVITFQRKISRGGFLDCPNVHRWPRIATDVIGVKSSNGKQDQKFHQNSVTTFQNGQFLSFNVCTTDPNVLGFKFELFSSVEGEHKCIGVAHILPLARNLSVKMATILGPDRSCVGYLMIDYLIVEPVPDMNMDMRISYQNHWVSKRYLKHGKGPQFSLVQIGKKVLSVKENIPASFIAASLLGVDYIEFSVQLCKDKIPVVYHDFHVQISAFNKLCQACEVYKCSIMDLSLKTLHSSKLNKYSEVVCSLPVPCFSFVDLDLEPFPTLEKVLEIVHPSVGFKIVVKYPQRLQDKTMEMINYFDRNEVVDIIVSSVMKNYRGRKIVFSSMDADTCVMLQRKQNRFPVLYRSKANNCKYPSYHDIRASSLEAAIHFAVSEKLLGVDFLAKEFLEYPKAGKRINSHGLVIFLWSDDVQCDPRSYKSEIDATVTDHINFSVECRSKKEIFYLPKNGSIDFHKAAVVPGIRRNTRHLPCASSVPRSFTDSQSGEGASGGCLCETA